MSDRKFVELSAGTETAHSHLLCWRSVLAGTLVTIMGFVMMTALGAALGGMSSEVMNADSSSAATVASGVSIWLIFSTVVALFCGGYFTMRIADFRANRVGAAHGFVLASIFFALTMSWVGSIGAGAIVGLSDVFAKLGRGAGLATREISTSPLVQNLVRKAVGDAKLKEDPQAIAQEVIVRLEQGDVDSLKSYLVAKTGYSEEEVNARVSQLKADFDVAAQRAREIAARGITKGGLAVLLIMLLGYTAAVAGARIGAHRNQRSPLNA